LDIANVNRCGDHGPDHSSISPTIVLQGRKQGRQDREIGTLVELIRPDAQAPNHLSTLAAMAGDDSARDAVPG
jgi:hypothetical protein